MLHVPYVERHALVSPTSSTSTSSGFFHHPGGGPVSAPGSGAARRHSPPLEPGSAGVRYSPYPSPLSSTTSRFSTSSHHSHSSHAELSPTSTSISAPARGETFTLPPIQPPARDRESEHGAIHLPPISSMDNLREAQCGEPMAVLRRLQCADDDERRRDARRVASAESLQFSAQRRHSVAEPVQMHRTVHTSDTDTDASSASASAGARAGGAPRTPLSAVAALPSLSYLPLPPRHHAHAQHPHDRDADRERERNYARDYPPQPRSAVEGSSSSSLFDRRPSLSHSRSGSHAYDDRPARSVPPSPYLDAQREREMYRSHYRQERPPSPPRSTSSASPSAGSSPSDAGRPGWRPW
ncbi:hypothetical protein C8Q76DRAFT_158970 [Earliella scabrosa]|nr:hypothetical protein C8Q76DRAFT_158970 [Earliella scabrosa]